MLSRNVRQRRTPCWRNSHARCNWARHGVGTKIACRQLISGQKPLRYCTRARHPRACQGETTTEERWGVASMFIDKAKLQTTVANIACTSLPLQLHRNWPAAFHRRSVCAEARSFTTFRISFSFCSLSPYTHSFVLLAAACTSTHSPGPKRQAFGCFRDATFLFSRVA